MSTASGAIRLAETGQLASLAELIIKLVEDLHLYKSGFEARKIALKDQSEIIDRLTNKLAIAKEALDEFLGPNNVGRVIDLSLDWGGSAVSIITDAALLNKLNDARKALEELR